MPNVVRASAFLLVLAVALPAAASDPLSPYGRWSGRARFEAKMHGTIDRAAHAVTDLTITVDSRGNLVGASPGNGCKASGRLSPGRTKQRFNLDVTLSGCKYRGFNRRFGGRLALDPQKNRASFSLHNLLVENARTYIFDVRATLRR